MTFARTVSILGDDSAASSPVRYLNRELSWLQFNERVLAMAADANVPLLERARFLAIFQTNLDEFFQVRVAGLKEQLAAEVIGTGADGARPAAQLAAISTIVDDLEDRKHRIFHNEVVPQLASHGIHFAAFGDLNEDDRRQLATTFDEQLLPVLTPLAVDPAHPFPYISSLSLNLAVLIRDEALDDGEVRFARVKVPPIVPRFLALADGVRLVPVEQVIAGNLDRLFPGLDVVEHHTFRLLRNADFEIEEEADDLLVAIETELLRRRFGEVVRLEVEPDMTSAVLDLLIDELGIDDSDVAVLPGPLDLAGLAALHDLDPHLDHRDLKYPAIHPVDHPKLIDASGEPRDIFEVLREHDVLLHHPYDAFATSVQRLLEQAARDPSVLGIKQTLYRTSGPDSPIIRALADAARAGKQVVALIELKARFDEAINIGWARTLEEAGVHVVYGVVGLKTHTKVALIVRQEHGKLRRYAHIGTGNYNERTARIYEDLGVLTADADIGADLTDLFNVLTGYSRHHHYRKLVVAPVAFRARMLEFIEREAAATDGHIVAKVNSLIDREMIDALYDASQRGTTIELIVRGICGLRPGVPGLSENITVRSVVGQFLEHSRIYRFGSLARGLDYIIGSGDLMERNLDRRVEALVPVGDASSRRRLEHILQVLLADDTQSWELEADARWHRLPAVEGIRAHDVFQQVEQH